MNPAAILLGGVLIAVLGKLLIPDVPTYGLIKSPYRQEPPVIRLVTSSYWLPDDLLYMKAGINYLYAILYVPDDANGGKVYINNRKLLISVGTPAPSIGKATGLTLELQGVNYVVGTIGDKYYLFESAIIVNQYENTFPA